MDELLTGTAISETLNGADGDDTLIGGLGDDTLNGGAGSDTADFSDIDVPVTVTIDADGNGIPDDCDTDCNGNGRPDDCDLTLFPGLYDCDGDGQIDGCGVAIDALSDRVDNAEQELGDLVPNLYAFTDGVNGTSISDGGRDMYDGGNRLSTNLRSDIPYSDSIVVRNDAIFGPGSAYMTKKINGIFMLFAENTGITLFRTSGSLGADGAGSFDTDTFITSNGQYRAFVKRVYGTTDASVNHIILVPAEITGAAQTIDQTTNSDFHEISGIAGADRLIFIVTSRWSSTGLPLEIDDARALADAVLALQGAPDSDGDGIIDPCDFNGCNAADVAEPNGELDLQDIAVFMTAFLDVSYIADLAEPSEVFDLADITVFVTAFTSGCP